MRGPLLELLDVIEVEEFDPPLDPPTAVAEAPGEVAVPTGLGFPPLLVAAEPPVAAATVVLLANETGLLVKPESKMG
jgi:hypothetical protein